MHLPKFDEATLDSLRTTLLCLVAAGVGIGLSVAVPVADAATAIIVTATGVFAAITAARILRTSKPASDPGITAATFLGTLAVAHWIIRHFFIDPGVGPFATDPWTICNALISSFFGFTAFALAGSCLGMTYFAARTTRNLPSRRRYLSAAAGLTVPVVMVVYADFLLLSCYF